MFLEFTAEQDSLRTTARQYFAERAPIPYVRGVYEEPGPTATDGVWRGIAELGIPGILVPETYGGTGGTMVDLGVVLEEAGRALYPGPILSSALAATAALIAVGSPDDHAALLPDLAAGERVATLALSEPRARAGWEAPSTRAEPGGEGWTVSGTKTHVPDATAADLLLVTAATPDGIGLFAVERAAAQVSAEAVLDGSRKQGSVSLAGTPARRVGAGDATAALAGVVDLVRIGLVLDAVGAAHAALDICLTYAKDRVAFGKPIGAFQHVQRLCVEMYGAVEMSRAAAYFAMFQADGDAAELHRLALIAKAYASDALVDAMNNAIQVHGGVGATWEHDIHLFYKRCVSMQQTLGGSLESTDELALIVIDQSDRSAAQ